MLKTEKLRRVPSSNMNAWRRSSIKTQRHSSQDGSILIGLIITMVIMASLGAGMIYLTTTSTFQELFANNHARAYNAAESGGRYASSLARTALATSMTSFNALATSLPNTYTMLNGDTFQIANWNPDPGSGSMVITFDSTGTTGSGFMRAKRKLRYRINPANQLGAGPPPVPPALPEPVSDFNVPKNQLDVYYSPVDASEVDIKDNPTVQGDPALNLKSDFYTMGLKWYDNISMAQLDDIRAANPLGPLLSYRVQVKMEIAPKDVNTMKYSDFNMFGICFRLDDTTISTPTGISIDNMYGISFFNIKADSTDATPEWYSTEKKGVVTPATTLISSNTNWRTISDNTWYVVLWKRVGSNAMAPHTLLAYKKLDASDWVLNADGQIKFWSTILVDVEEKIGTGTADANGFNYTSGVRYNVIKSYLAADTQGTTGTPSPELLYHRRVGDPSTGEILWGGAKFKPINWTVASGSGAVPGSSTNMVADSSLTTANYNTDTYNAISNKKAREIGLHVYYDSTSAQNIFYDNFYIDLSPTTGGGGLIDGGGIIEIGG